MYNVLKMENYTSFSTYIITTCFHKIFGRADNEIHVTWAVLTVRTGIECRIILFCYGLSK